MKRLDAITAALLDKAWRSRKKLDGPVADARSGVTPASVGLQLERAAQPVYFATHPSESMAASVNPANQLERVCSIQFREQPGLTVEFSQAIQVGTSANVTHDGEVPQSALTAPFPTLSNKCS